MSASKGYPKFIWIIVAVILIVIVGYALLSRQPIEELKFPGGGVKFGSVQNEESVTFSISYDKDEFLIEGHAEVYLANAPTISLSVDSQRPFDTKSVTVPNPGTYAYRIEQREVQLLISGSDMRTRVPVNVNMSGEGKINVQAGKSYKVTPVLVLRGGGKGGEWTTSLEEILSEEERRDLEEEALKELQKEFGIE